MRPAGSSSCSSRKSARRRSTSTPASEALARARSIIAGDESIPTTRRFVDRATGIATWPSPTASSTSDPWLNLVERWFAELTRKKLQRSTHQSIKELTIDLDAWVETWNEDPKPFVWHETADQILDSLKRHLTNL